MTEERYSGFANYETWSVACVLQHDAIWQQYWPTV